MEFQTSINNGIKKLRKNAGLTQEKFAELVGLSIAGLKKLEQNKYQPSSDTIDKICGAFKIHPIDLLINNEPKEKTETLKVIELKLQNLSEQELIKVNGFIDLIKE